jgi:hypothetical protein
MLSKEQLKQILIEQRESLLVKPFGTERKKLQVVPKYIQLPHVIVITGLRRVGKSVFLRQVISKFYSDSEFYYINFEDERFLSFNAGDFNQIYEILVELFGEHKTFFIDEIQNMKNFQNFVRRFYDNGFKFFITGSNANLLSNEIGTRLTGRHIDITIHPFSFTEYLDYNKINISSDSVYLAEEKAKIKYAFGNYLVCGGMPEMIKYNEPEILIRIYNDIVIKDIAVRYNVANLYEMRDIYQHLITNFAKKFSFTKIQKIIGLGSVNTVKNYITYLADTNFVFIVNKFDYSFKKQIVNEKKLFVADNGFIPLISTKLTKDRGWLLENLVFNECNKSHKVYYFNENKKECDFVIEKDGKIENAIQVCSELNIENRDREYKGLLEAVNFFKLKQGMILTADQEEIIKIEDKKIVVKPVWKWLLSDKCI